MALSIADNPVPLAIDADGVFRVGGTRVTLDTLVAAFVSGATAEEIVLQYPSLTLAAVYSVLGYYLHHRSEVDEYLRHRQQQAAVVQSENKARFDQAGLRERLQARRTNTRP